MRLTKNKKMIISIIIVTIISICINIFITGKKLNEYQRQVNIVISNIIGKVNEKYPEIKEEEIMAILDKNNSSIQTGTDILNMYGINIDETSAIEILNAEKEKILFLTNMNIILLIVMILIILAINLKLKDIKLKKIIKYIDEINRKNYDLKIEENSEDELSNLSNELYKITVMLRNQADLSLKDKKALQTSIEDISHQLKTPLTSISIMLDNIRENPNMVEDIRQSFIHEITRQIEWINWLVISLLKLSKLDSNTAIFTPKEIKVKTLVDDVVKNLAIPIEIKQINMIIDNNDSKFIGDYNWQKEALTNILKNCIEHTPECKNIYIKYKENNFYTRILIKDEGVGIDKQDVKHIFERFYKGKNSSENSVGIGLALAKTIIEKDNGYIICTSEIGKGTTFEIKYMKR